MEAVLITEAEGIAAIEDEWRSLAELRENAFVSPEWFKSWFAQSPGSASPLIAAARRGDGSLAGVLPLVLDAARRPRMIRFAGASFGDRLCPAARPEDEAGVGAAAFAALKREGFGRHVVMLDHIDPQSGWWRPGGGAVPETRTGVLQRRYELPYIRLEGLDWEGYLASRSRNFRQQVRKRERNLSQEHDVRLRPASSATLGDDLAHLFRLHERRWEGRGHSSLSAPGAKEFLGAFAAAAQRREWLRLLLLEVDEEPVAAFLGWRIGATYTFYQSGFDPDWADRSVGIVMMARTIQSAIEEGAAEFDMLLGTESYKKRFASESREVQTIALPGGLPSRLLLASEANARSLGRRLAARTGEGRATRLLRRLLPSSRRF